MKREDANRVPENHRPLQDFLAGAQPEILPALRHLVTCPVCLAAARAVLCSGADTAAGELPETLCRTDPAAP